MEASRSKNDNEGGGELAFRELGYSFFNKHMQGQPPSPDPNSFFFFLTSKTIVIKWTNPVQYETGLTGATTGMPLDATSPIVTAPTNSTGGQIWFPIVNRIMIQIRNLDDMTYQTWGVNSSPKSNTVFPNGRVICEKDRIILPAAVAANAALPTNERFGPTYNKQGARTEKKHKLKDLANSIILYKDKSIPDTLEGTDATPEPLIEKRVYSAKQSSDAENEKYTIPDSENGFEIKIWLENQYDSGLMTQNDFNVVTLRTMDRIMDETGNEITSSSSNSLKNFIKKPIKFLTVDAPTKIRVAEYNEVDGFHVKLKRITGTTIHYLECIIPRDAINPTDAAKKNEDNKKVESTSSEGQENEVYFKGYFIEYQTIEADTNASKNLDDLATEFGTNGTSWAFVDFETFSSSPISFTKNETKNSASNDMATDTEAALSTVIYTEGAGTNSNNKGFISAAPYSGGFSTKTSDITWSTSKAFRLNQGDNKFYRFRIRGVNNGNKNAGPVSTKYFYFRFNEPDQITWKTPNPKFNAGPLYWDITLNWNSIIKSSKADNNENSYTTTDLAIMEYKLQRRDAASENWQTISYWKNTATNGQLTTQDYSIWPTPVQTTDSNYTSNSDTTNWTTTNDTNKAEWVYYEATLGGPKVYTQEARLLKTDQSTAATYKDRNPSFRFKIQARNYLFGKRVDANASNAIIVDIKQWFIEGTLDTTNAKNITDTRWSANSLPSTALVTTAHTTGYTPSLQDNNDYKYEIKFYEKDSADTKSPWKNSNNVTDYDDTSTRRVKYTTNSSASRTTNDNKPYNDVPDKDYIAYQWKITDESGKSTVDSTTGLSIDRYVIEEVIEGSDNGTYTQTIYSPDFTRGPANWHIREYSQTNPVSNPSFKFKVKAYNFFNSTSSNYSTTSTELTPIKPSVPLFSSNVAVTGIDGKVSSKPTFTLTDTGITILVDEPDFTGQTSTNTNQYQDQAISISEFALLEGKFNTSTAMSTGEITLINSHGTTSRSGSSIQGNQSQVATFFHPNGYTETPNTELKDLTAGKIEYTFHAKNVLKNEFSETSSCTLTIEKPSPGANFKHCPEFTWIKNTNKVQLEFFRKATISSTSTEILKDGDSSTIAPLSAITAGCHVTNEIKKLQWNVKCSGAPASGTKIIQDWGDVGTPTGYNTNGDNAITVAYTISDIGIEEWSQDTPHQIRYRVRNQYNAGWFEDPQADEYCEIKLTAPNTIGGITSVVTYALASGNNNILQINWTKPTEYGLHYKHKGVTLTAQTQPNIKTYKVYFNDAALWYVYTRTATTQDDATNDLTITSGTTVVEKWSNSERTTGYDASLYIRIAPEKTYTIEKITAINWLYDSESAAQSAATTTTYYNGDRIYPPIDGSITVTNTNAPIPTPFSNYSNQGILISGTDVRTVKKLGVTTNGTPLTNVLLNAQAVKETNSTMGIKIKITGATTATTSECKFDSDGIVLGNNLTLTYTWSGTTKNLAQITVGVYSDLYKDKTSATDNKTYWFINDSIKLKWLAAASEISDFYGKNLTFSVVVTYYGETESTLTKQIETGYYDKTIGNPSTLVITPSYNPFTCLGLPILESNDTLTVATSFDNKSEHWFASSAVNTITLGTNVASVTTSKHVHSSNGSTITLTNPSDMGTYAGTSLVKDAQITVVAKNCNGTISETHSSKYIYDPNTLTLITTIANQNLSSNTIDSTGNISSSTDGGYASKPKFIVLKTPTNFNPLTDHGTNNKWNGASKFAKIDVTNQDVNIAGSSNNNTSQVPIYDGKFVSETYFKNKFGTIGANYNANVGTFLTNMAGTVPSNASNIYADSNNNIQDILKTNYRWGIFSMSYKNSSSSAKAVNYAEFSLGPNANCDFISSDLYSNGSKSVANVEIWYKCINDTANGIVETRWNKLCESNTADSANATNDINQSYTGATAADLPSSGWILNAGDTTASSAINTTLETTWAATKRIQFLIKQEVAKQKVLKILIAIGIKNSIDKFYSIPRAFSTSYIFRTTTGTSNPYNAATIG